MRQKDDVKEQRIKAAVAEVILEEGFAGASMSKIAKCAGVSPATVYTYFENKDAMLQDVFLEYDEGLWLSVLSRARRCTESGARIEAMVRGYYDYMVENEKVFNFIDQFSGCPSLMKNCCGRKNMLEVVELLQEMKDRNEIKPYSSRSLFGIIFNPVKSLRFSEMECGEAESLLDELVQMIENAVLA